MRNPGNAVKGNPSRVRRALSARVAGPAILVGGVAIAGMVAFSPGPAAAAGNSYQPVVTSPPPTLPASIRAKSAKSRVVLSGSTAAPGSGLSYVALPRSFVNPGEVLFSANCSTCHGPLATGTSRAPNLQGLGAGTVDFWVSTGRMPLENSSVQATRKPPRFNRLQTLEIATFVQSLTPGEGVGIPIVQQKGADLEQGNAQFVLNCRGVPHHHRCRRRPRRGRLCPEPAPGHAPPDRRGHAHGAGQHAPFRAGQHHRPGGP